MTVIVYGNHVETPLARRWTVAQKIAGHQRQLLLFGVIYRCLGGLYVMRCPGLDLDKTEHIPVPAHQIQFSARMRGAGVAGDDHVAAPSKIEVGILFSASASTLVSRHLLRWKGSIRQPIENVHGDLRQASGEHEWNSIFTLRPAPTPRCDRNHHRSGRLGACRSD